MSKLKILYIVSIIFDTYPDVLLDNITDGVVIINSIAANALTLYPSAIIPTRLNAARFFPNFIPFSLSSNQNF